jgi:outer membrane lipoprotein carrier protein
VHLSSLLRVVVILALAITFAAPAPAADVHAIAQAVDNRYDQLRTLQTDFTETYTGAGMERTESGTLLLKKPGKMRWEYRSPKQKLFLSDGTNAWFYIPGERQARTAPMRKLDDLRSPLAFLLGKTKLEKELQSLSLAPDVTPSQPGNVVLRGVPKAMADRVNQVLLEITPDNWISRIVIEEADGSTTEYRFSNEKANVTVADSIFHFDAPDGVEVITGEFGQ